jgi:hypothetical protein
MTSADDQAKPDADRAEEEAKQAKQQEEDSRDDLGKQVAGDWSGESDGAEDAGQ